jgi:hypothetical protein
MVEDRNTRYKGAKATGVLIPLLILLVALLVILFKFPSQRNTGTAEKEQVYLSFDDFYNMIGGNDQLGESQKRELFSRHVGKYVIWAGEVAGIEKQPSGDFVLKVKHLPSTQDYDVCVSFDPSFEEKLEKIQTGQTINYTAKLFRFEPPSRYFLLDGKIE